MEISELIDYDVTAIEGSHLYNFEWIDNLNFLRPPADLITDCSRRKRIEAAVARRFSSEGWEGTGKLSILWLPGFVFPMKCDIPEEGILMWHVKQHEDGISWLLSPIPLPFERYAVG